MVVRDVFKLCLDEECCMQVTRREIQELIQTCGLFKIKIKIQTLYIHVKRSCCNTFLINTCMRRALMLPNCIALANMCFK